MKRWIDWALLTICVVCSAAMILRAQADLSPTTGSTKIATPFVASQSGRLLFETGNICGTDSVNHTANIDLLQISCVDYEALRKVAPQVPWPFGTRTQVLVHVRAGEVVRVTVGGVTKFEDIITDAWGRRVSMVQFEGINHTAVDVKILAEIK